MAGANTVVTDETEIREFVATANRMLYMEGQLGPSGHVSMRHPDEDVVFMNSIGQSRTEIRPADVIRTDLDGEPLDPDAREPPGERVIHTALYRARDDVTAVIHAHPDYLTLFSITGTQLQPVSQRGTVLAEGPLPMLHRPGKIESEEEGEMMLEAMDGAKQLLIQNHGSVVCDETILRAFVRAYNLEKNAEWQYRASALGSPNPLSAEQVELEYTRNWIPVSIEKIWRYCERRAIQAGLLPERW